MKIDKNYNKEDLYKLHPREKIVFNCENCGVEYIKNASALFGKEKFLCWNCSMKIGSKEQNNRQKIKENSLILSKKDIPEVLGRCRDTIVKYICEDCGFEGTSKIGRFNQCPKILCESCYKKFKSQKRFGVDHPLQIYYKLGVKITHTEEGIKKTRDSVIKNLWHKNWEKRKKSIDKFGWDILNVDFNNNLIQVKSRCCNFIKIVKMGDENPLKWRCNCFKNKNRSSKKELQLKNYLENFYPNEKIISSYKGWCKDKTCKGPSSYEIDIFFPKFNFGIEFNGIYWHNKQDQTRETLKLKRAKDVGIKIINIWEDDWDHNKTDQLNKIKESLNEWCNNT